MRDDGTIRPSPLARALKTLLIAPRKRDLLERHGWYRNLLGSWTHPHAMDYMSAIQIARLKPHELEYKLRYGSMAAMPPGYDDLSAEAVPPPGPVDCYQIFDACLKIRNTGNVPWKGRKIAFVKDRPLMPIARWETPLPDLKPGQAAKATIPIDARGGEGMFRLRFQMLDADGVEARTITKLPEIPVRVRFRARQ